MSRPIYYLVSVSHNEEYIMGISFDKENLENMIIHNTKGEQDFKFEIRENLKIFQIAVDYDIEKQCVKNKIIYINYPNKKYHYSELYAFNITKRINNGFDYIIENGIIDLYCFHDKVNEILLLKDNISSNPILFDTYYEEGIMNA